MLLMWATKRVLSIYRDIKQGVLSFNIKQLHDGLQAGNEERTGKGVVNVKMKLYF